MRSHVVLRWRFAGDRWEDAVAKGATRYILIGAGFDTYALRQPAWTRALKIVEVDHPATQSAKRDLIAEAGFAPRFRRAREASLRPLRIC